jgi:DNA invertase Pin-like site-specific DNA recombinase
VETAKQTGRAAFGEMISYLKSHPPVRVLLVEKTDRLYRNLKDVHLRLYLPHPEHQQDDEPLHVLRAR